MNRARRSGFTFIEILVVMGVIVIFSLIALLNLPGTKGSQNLKTSLEEILAVVNATRNRAVTEEDGKGWGLRFTNPTSTNPFKYEVFSGSSYMAFAVSRTHYLRREVKFSEPTASSTYDLIFSPLGGRVSQNKIISLLSDQKDSLVGDLIVKILGNVTFRVENDVTGYWHLDENAFSATRDASGSALNGTLMSGLTACSNPPTGGCPTWNSGGGCKAGSCLAFDGLDDYVALPTMNIANEITVEAWVYSSNFAQNGFVIGKNPVNTQWELIFEGGLVWRGGSSNPPQITCLAPSNNTWHHVAATQQGTNASLYIDGVNCSNGSVVALGNGNGVVEIGRFNSGYYFNGRIDEVRVYNRALSAAEISAHYNDLR